MSQQENHGSTKAYVIGFILSIILTIIPIMLVLNHAMSAVPLVVTIIIAAVLQFLVQLILFMHIRESEKPGWNVMALILGMIFVITIVGGSAWIMTFNSQSF
ncbi:cytochrome o ubiquinol oxidase subunit IV [Aneurinibacillus sp. Ricciae_BoGa-3]|uniref:cytochrome o ubiquinol oxidase subunit IV n=1 Tax=Aneurinibacillus sp. Ricciae_BoGa-3 TaxID=3022697 RepID=UPI00233FC53C|nr:cytochrome o ubiquinol oxidase subunit IV [Aneurinibacillus sp. Ricciae_BoGa-3]WCK54456.1 cytochrome o ubiquinol oxidase subunit IV [Aneurinibacillus sp. Ricciae_BoGa-3]